MLHVILSDLIQEDLLNVQMKILDRPHQPWDQIDLEIISDEAYYQRFFSGRRNADLLIISEYLYSDAIAANFPCETIILTEAVRPDKKINDHCTLICKYGSLDLIHKKIKELAVLEKLQGIDPDPDLNYYTEGTIDKKKAVEKAEDEPYTAHLYQEQENTAEETEEESSEESAETAAPETVADPVPESVDKPVETAVAEPMPVPAEKPAEAPAPKDTKLIVVTSASGGVGKTTLSLGLASALVEKGQSVLYINADEMNTFQWKLNVCTVLSVEVKDIFSKIIPDWTKIKGLLQNEAFDFLPPFAMPLHLMDLDSDVYEKVAAAAMLSREYDKVIVDLGNIDGKLSMRFLNSADNVLMVSHQDAASVAAISYLSEKLDTSNNGKYYTVCNAMRNDRPNAYQNGQVKIPFSLDAYVAYQSEFSLFGLSQIGQMDDMQNILELMMLI